MIKKIFFALIFFMTFAKISIAAANELDAAEMRLVCAICSMGAYSDDDSYLMRSMLTERGWQIEKLAQKTSRADARAYLVSRGDVKILTVAGTERIKDVEVDFRVGRVHLNDNDEPLAPYEKKVGDKVFVHRGFRDYADVVLSDGLAERLTTSLKKNPNETLYLTGHSLGGAVAIIAALRLADSGVDKSRLKVITFGSPAVGSQALAKIYDDKIDLTRVVMKGDAIKRSLRGLGYVQFGEELTYRQSITSDHFEHKMAVYLDCAIRDYYAAGGTLSHDTQNKIAVPIYVAPILTLKGSLHKSDAEIVLTALDESLTNHFSALMFADKRSLELNEEQISDADFAEYTAAAKSHGCQYVLIRVLRIKKIRDDLFDNKTVTLEEIILDAQGVPLSMYTAGASTETLTIFEAALSAQETLNDNLKNFITNKFN